MTEGLTQTPSNPLGQYTADGFLDEAIMTMRKRAVDRDVEQERVMSKIVGVFNALTGNDLSETEGWQFMTVLKMVRAQTGEFNPDDFVDMAAYIGLTGESAAKAAKVF